MSRPFWLQPTVERSCPTLHEGIKLETIETPMGECYYRVSGAGRTKTQNGNQTLEAAKMQVERAVTERDQAQK